MLKHFHFIDKKRIDKCIVFCYFKMYRYHKECLIISLRFRFKVKKCSLKFQLEINIYT